MLNVVFKNVGKGDAIIIEWVDAGSQKLAIIDCGIIRLGRINPILEHIKKLHLTGDLDSIECMILSHPHTDHFLGFYEVLSYCENNNISIERFWHTGESTASFMTALSRATKGHVLKGELIKLYKKIIQMHKDKSSVLKKAGVVNDDTQIIELLPGLKLKLWAPSQYDDINTFIERSWEFEPELSAPNNNSHANLLSTIIEIGTTKWSIIFTSDSTVATLNRLKTSIIDKKKTVIVAQMPHHGSVHNLDKNFWEEIIDNAETNTAAVISCGGKIHPHKEVVDFCNEKFESLHCTNYSGYFDQLKKNVLLDSPNISSFSNFDYSAEYSEIIFRIQEDGQYEVAYIDNDNSTY